MKKSHYLLIFLIINFGGLALGNLFMGDAVNEQWYESLNKAPWTPPGWVFGFAWTVITLCFSWYLAELFDNRSSRFLWILYGIQVLLNVSWNFVFFQLQLIGVSFILIILLTLIILYYFITFRNDRLKYAKYILLPYLIWLLIATSLNGYIVFNN